MSGIFFSMKSVVINATVIAVYFLTECIYSLHCIMKRVVPQTGRKTDLYKWAKRNVQYRGLNVGVML